MGRLPGEVFPMRSQSKSRSQSRSQNPNHREHGAALVLLAAVLALSTAACGGGNGEGGEGITCSGNNVVAKEANDYSFSSTLTFPPISVAPNTELTFDWGGVTADLVRHPVDARADIDMVMVMMWSLTLEELQTKLNADTLAQRDLVVVPLTFFADGTTTSARLFQFTLNGNPLTPAEIMPYFDAATYDPAKHTYTLMVASGMTLGQGTLMIQSFRLDPASTNATVTVTGDSTKLAYMANLHSLKPTGIPAGQAAITLDWGQMTTNAMGNPFIKTNITDAIVGHYTQTPTQLESQFLDLELIATELYRGTIPMGTVVDFSMLMNDAGQRFSGIDATGTWIVALECGGCRNPAPWYLSVLKPCP
jgi:hypothetical protein